MHLRRSRQVPRRVTRGALRSKVARGCAIFVPTAGDATFAAIWWCECSQSNRPMKCLDWRTPREAHNALLRRHALAYAARLPRLIFIIPAREGGFCLAGRASPCHRQQPKSSAEARFTGPIVFCYITQHTQGSTCLPAWSTQRVLRWLMAGEAKYHWHEVC